MKSRALRLGAACLLVLVLAAAVVPTGMAYTLREGDKVVIQEGEVIEDDLYVGAATLEVNGTIKGDLVAAGQKITIGPKGVVEGDLLAAGQSITILGTVQDDVRAAGMAISLASGGKVGSDFVGFGYSVSSAADSVIRGDVLAAGGQVLMAGEVAGDARVFAGAFKLEGTIGGNLVTEVGAASDQPPFNPMMFVPDAPQMPTVPGGLTISEQAKVSGNIEYTAPQEAVLPAGVAGGTVKFIQAAVKTEETPTEQQSNAVVDYLVKLAQNFLSILIIGLLLLWRAPGLVDRGTARLVEKPLPSLGWGLVALVSFGFGLLALVIGAILLAILLGLVTLGGLVSLVVGVGGLLLSGLSVGFLFASSYLAQILVSVVGGRWILGRIQPGLAQNRFWPFLLGLVIFALLVSIPYLGWLINALAVLSGLGVLWLLGRQWLGERRAQVTAPAAFGD